MSTADAKQLVRLDVLLCTTGQRHAFVVRPTDAISTIKQRIQREWPQAWPQPVPPTPSMLRLLHLGRFWGEAANDGGDPALSAYNLPLGRTTVVHLVVRPEPPAEPETTSAGASSSSSTSGQRAQVMTQRSAEPGSVRSNLWSRLHGRNTSSASGLPSTGPPSVPAPLSEPAPASASPSSPLSDVTLAASSPGLSASPAQAPARPTSNKAESRKSHDHDDGHHLHDLDASVGESTARVEHREATKETHSSVVAASPATRSSVPEASDAGHPDSAAVCAPARLHPTSPSNPIDDTVNGGCCGGCIIC